MKCGAGGYDVYRGPGRSYVAGPAGQDDEHRLERVLGQVVVADGPPANPVHGRPVCDQGVCDYRCTVNWADCDGNAVLNGCEANLLTDPLNCGGCGIVCDAVEGQPCINGQCATSECGVR